MPARGLIVAAVVLMLINLVSYWVLLEKGGMPGWGSIVPIYNVVLLSRLGGFSGWWVLWFLLPGIGGIIWSLTVQYSIPKNFGKGELFSIGTALLPFIFIPILAFTAEP